MAKENIKVNKLFNLQYEVQFMSKLESKIKGASCFHVFYLIIHGRGESSGKYRTSYSPPNFHINIYFHIFQMPMFENNYCCKPKKKEDIWDAYIWPS